MDFNQLVLETLDSSDIKVERASEELLNRIRNRYPYSYSGKHTEMGWKVRRTNPKVIYIVFPRNPHPKKKDSEIYRTYYLSGMLRGYTYPESEDVKAIKLWELKQTLNPSTVNTFNELIDEL